MSQGKSFDFGCLYYHFLSELTQINFDMYGNWIVLNNLSGSPQPDFYSISGKGGTI